MKLNLRSYNSTSEEFERYDIQTEGEARLYDATPFTLLRNSAFSQGQGHFQTAKSIFPSTKLNLERQEVTYIQVDLPTKME